MNTSLIIYYSILFFSVLVGVYKFKRLLLAGRIIFYLLCFILVKEVISYIIALKFGFNIWFYKALSPIDYIILCCIYYTLYKAKVFHYYVLVSLLVILGLFISNLSDITNQSIDLSIKLLKSFFLVSFSLILFGRIVSENYEIRLFKNSSVWFNSGILIFYVINIFFWGLFNLPFVEKGELAKKISRLVFEYGNYIMYSFFCISLYVNNFILYNRTSNSNHD